MVCGRTFTEPFLKLVQFRIKTLNSFKEFNDNPLA